jgi:putative ABC transport system permease protein
MLRLAYRNLFQSKVRLAMSVGGVALALMLVLALDAIMTGSEKRLTAYIDNSEADVWVAQSGVRNLHMVSSWIPAWVTDEVRDVPGVDSVTLLMYQIAPVEIESKQNLAYVFGLPKGAAMGKPWSLEEGESIPESGEAIIDSSVAERSDIALGDKVKILGQELEVVGLSKDTSTLTNSVAFISMEDFERVRGGGQLVSFVLAKAEPGQSPEAVAERIEEDVGGVTAQTRAAFAEQERRLVNDMAGDLLAIMNLAGFMTGLAMVALTVYTATLARRSEYGVLKALGARNSRLYGVVLAQALYSVVLGFAVGLTFTLLLSAIVPALGSNLPLQVGATSLLKVGSASLVIAALAAVLPIRQIAGLDPATVFRG